MYTSFYDLDIKPFQIASDPKFIWLGEKHKEALATLTYGVLDNKGFMLLTGDVGTGKTTLINTLIKGLSDDILYASVPDPRLSLNDLLNYIARSFGIRKNFKTKGKFLIYFSDFLAQCHENKKQVLLLIDEAQLLTQDLLEEIRLLSNIQKDGLNLLNIFFVGQDEFNEILERPENRAVAQRLTLNYHLKPLTDQETENYIKHRLIVAGSTRQIFDAEAFMEIHRYSGGFPRRINILCDHCLLTGFVREQRVIGADVVRNCAYELKIPQYTARREAPQRPLPPQFEVPASVPASQQAPAPPKPAPNVSPAKPQPAFIDSEELPTRVPPPPQRPILEKPGVLSFRPLLVGAVLLVIVGGALYSFDRPTFDALLDGAGRQLFQLQKKLQAQFPAVLQMEVQQQEQEAAKAKEVVDRPVKEPVRERSAVEAQPKAEPEENVHPESAVEKEGVGEMQSLPVGPETGGQLDSPEESSPAGSALVSSAPVPVLSESAPAVVSPQIDSEVEPPMPEAAPEPLETASSPKMVLAPPESEVQESPPSPEIELPKETIMVRFNNDSSDFFFTDLRNIDGFVAGLKQHTDAVLVISGHTDSFGSEGYNYRLSLFRANMVKSFFLGKGIPSHQLRVQAFGSEKPIASNDTEEGRRMNRRVEIEILH